MNPAAAPNAAQHANNRPPVVRAAGVVSDARCIRLLVRSAARKPRSHFAPAVTGLFIVVTASEATAGASYITVKQRGDISMGGKTLDQFNSRQQARNKKIKDTNSPALKIREHADDLSKNTPPVAVK